MALRVLLADESATIKKVFQLALQDYGVEVMTVSLGSDVVTVAQKFKPDIVFSDVLLQKKSGYDVCREIKSTPELSNVPVVLVWSGFMELDQQKFQDCGANGNLEKPFETFQLREIVQNLVPKTQTQTLGEFLSFPSLPEFDEKPRPKPAAMNPPPPPAPAIELGGLEVSTAEPIRMPPPQPPPPPAIEALEPEPMEMLQPEPAERLIPENVEHLIPENVENLTPMSPQDEPTAPWSMDKFDELPPIPAELETEDEYLAVKLPTEPLKKAPQPPAPPLPAETEDEIETKGEEANWIQKTLTNFKLDRNKLKDEPPSVSYSIPQDKIDPDSVITNTMTLKKERPADNAQLKGVPGKAPTRKLNIEPEEDLELDLGEETKAQPHATPAVPQLTERQLEAVIRAQSKEVIEKVVWQVVPEIATRIIEREIERLLKERLGK